MGVCKQLICIGLSITLVIGSVFPGYAYAAGFQSDGKTLGDYTSGASSNYPEATANSNIAIANILTASGSGSLYSYIFNISTNTNYLPTISSWLSTINSQISYLRTDVSNIYTRLAVLSTMNATLTNIYNQLTETLNKVVSIDGALSDIAYFDVGNEDNYRTWTLPELVNDIRLTLLRMDRELVATAHTFAWFPDDYAYIYADVRGADNRALSYQWQFFSTAEGLWLDMGDYDEQISGSNSSFLVVLPNDYRMKYCYYRCVVTASDGEVAYTPPIVLDYPSLYQVIDAIEGVNISSSDVLETNSNFIVEWLKEFDYTDGDGLTFKVPEMLYRVMVVLNDANGNLLIINENLVKLMESLGVEGEVPDGGGTEDADPYLEQLENVNETLDQILAGIVVLDVLTLWNTVIGTLDFVGIGTSISALGDTMKGVFPFSLVFDVVIIFGLFAADPVTPVFKVPFPDGAGGTYVHTFDMGMFDPLAAAFRVLITVAFCLGLAYITRNFIFKTGGNE